MISKENVFSTLIICKSAFERKNNLGSKGSVRCNEVFSFLCAGQDRQCHIILSGEAWLGKFAVWGYPMLHPWDMRIWEAVPLPPRARFIPNNVISCARNGAGACAIRGADYDGDNFMFSNDPSLLKFLALTPEASAELRREAEKVCAELLKAPAEPLPSIAAYRAYDVLSVATLPVC